MSEQAPGFRDGQRDHSRIGGWLPDDAGLVYKVLGTETKPVCRTDEG